MIEIVAICEVDRGQGDDLSMGVHSRISYIRVGKPVEEVVG